MLVEQVLVLLYLAACIGIGVYASRKVLASRDEYWVAGRRIGTAVNTMAIMASLASGGSIIGVMGLAYSKGIPTTLALFAGAVIGFPFASILVARQLRNFGRYTITDFLAFPVSEPGRPGAGADRSSWSRSRPTSSRSSRPLGSPPTRCSAFPYDTALVIATLVFITYVSIGGMIAITWTDVVQGVLMLIVVVGTALAVIWRAGSPFELIRQATQSAPELGRLASQDIGSSVGYFIIWATAIPVIPHIVMRVFTAKDGRSAQLSLNLAMLAYSVMILAAVLAIVPVGKLAFPDLADADQVFLRVIQSEFPAVIRGIAVAAVLAAVMSTTDALLLACSSAIAHDLLGDFLRRRASDKTLAAIRVASAWVIGILALYWALSPPELLSRFYTAGIGLLSAGLFVPTIAGLWWKRANRAGGVASLVAGAGTYGLTLSGAVDSAFLRSSSLCSRARLRWPRAGCLERPKPAEMREQIAALHVDEPPGGS